eukprot:Rmarinus@m.7529
MSHDSQNDSSLTAALANKKKHFIDQLKRKRRKREKERGPEQQRVLYFGAFSVGLIFLSIVSMVFPIIAIQLPLVTLKTESEYEHNLLRYVGGTSSYYWQQVQVSEEDGRTVSVRYASDKCGIRECQKLEVSGIVAISMFALATAPSLLATYILIVNTVLHRGVRLWMVSWLLGASALCEAMGIIVWCTVFPFWHGNASGRGTAHASIGLLFALLGGVAAAIAATLTPRRRRSHGKYLHIPSSESAADSTAVRTIVVDEGYTSRRRGFASGWLFGFGSPSPRVERVLLPTTHGGGYG